MSGEPMELAVNYNRKKLEAMLPVMAQRKYDGVPVTFIRDAFGIRGITRQNTVVTSIPHLVDAAQEVIKDVGGMFTAEIVHPSWVFKKVSGLVRQINPTDESRELLGIIFDSCQDGYRHIPYADRMNSLSDHMATLGDECPFRIVPSIRIRASKDIDPVTSKFMSIPGIEGVMYHQASKPFSPGTRAKGMMRYKPQPVIDLRVLNFEEAHSEAGEPLGMLGRVNVELWRRDLPAGSASDWEWHPGRKAFRRTIGVGPGKLTHEERKKMWDAVGHSGVVRDGVEIRTAPDQLFAAIKYMPDESYEALRQPTIQFFRCDKDEGDIL